MTSAGSRIESSPCPARAAMDQHCPGCCKCHHRTPVDPREMLLLYQRAYLRALRAENEKLSRTLRKALARARSPTPKPTRSLYISRTSDAGRASKTPSRTLSCPPGRDRRT